MKFESARSLLYSGIDRERTRGELFPESRRTSLSLVECSLSLVECSLTQVVYETMPGWEEDISKVRTYADLPLTARQYIERCEELMGGLPCKYIGVGPGRDAMVVKP